MNPKHNYLLLAAALLVIAVVWYAALSMRQGAGTSDQPAVVSLPAPPAPGMPFVTSTQSHQFYPAFSTSSVASGTAEEFTQPIEERTPVEGVVLKVYRITASAVGFSPSRIVIRQGDTVQIQFVASDASYDFVVARPIGAYVEAVKGETAVFGFTAGAPGTYEFSCKLKCPGGELKRGKIMVQ